MARRSLSEVFGAFERFSEVAPRLFAPAELTATDAERPHYMMRLWLDLKSDMHRAARDLAEHSDPEIAAAGERIYGGIADIDAAIQNRSASQAGIAGFCLGRVWADINWIIADGRHTLTGRASHEGGEKRKFQLESGPAGLRHRAIRAAADRMKHERPGEANSRRVERLAKQFNLSASQIRRVLNGDSK